MWGSLKRAAGFLVLLGLAVAAGYGFLWQANAPLGSLDQAAWMDWARLAPDMAGLVLFSALVAVISVFGAMARMMSPAKPDTQIYKVVPAQAPALNVSNPSPIPAPARSSVRPAAADRPDLRAPVAVSAPTVDDDEFDVPSLSALSPLSQVPPMASAPALDAVPAEMSVSDSVAAPLAPALPPVSPPLWQPIDETKDNAATLATSAPDSAEEPENLGAKILPFVSPRLNDTEAAPVSTSEAEGPFCVLPETASDNTDVQALLEALPITALEPDPERAPPIVPMAAPLPEPPAGIAPEIARALLGLDEPEVNPAPVQQTVPSDSGSSEAEELAAMAELRALIAEDIMATDSPQAEAPATEQVLEFAAEPVTASEPELLADAPVEIAPVAHEPQPVAAPLPSPSDMARETYDQAMAQTLAHWPEAARAEMQDTLAPRISHLTQTEDPALQGAAALLAAGQLAPALAQIRSRAERLAATGRQPEAAEAYRTLATLYLGRDDAAALDGFALSVQNNPYDGRSLSYLARRHAALGQFDRAEHYGRMLLAAPDSTAEQLTILPMLGDLALKRGATEEACGYFADYQALAEQQATAEADNLQLRSSLALSYARLAQIQELRGARDQAVQLYGRAHGLFDQLASAVPGHAGLANMRDTAARDLQRLGA